MKFLILLTASLSPLLGVEPRISQISPSNGDIPGLPVAWDLDGDGDLDVAYLMNLSQIRESTWFENLGHRRFSPAKSLGYGFGKNGLTHLSESLLADPGGGIPSVVAFVRNVNSGVLEVHRKSPASESWEKIRTFPKDTEGYFLESPAKDSPFLFTTGPGEETPLDVWRLDGTEHLTKIGSLEVPRRGSNSDPYRILAIDLDGDGDSELIFSLFDDSLVIQRLSENRFAEVPVALGAEIDYMGDLDGDRLPDFIRESASRSGFRNEGDFTFTPFSIDDLLETKFQSIGLSGGRPAVIGLERLDSSTISLSVYRPGLPLGTFTARTADFEFENVRSPVFADFDDDGSSDLLFISRSTSIVSPTRTGSHRVGSDFSIGFQTFGYDRVFASWGQAGGLTPPAPISPPPVNCADPALGDFDNDGDPDIIVGPDSEGRAIIMLNDGQGRFPNPRLLDEIIPATFDRTGYEVIALLPVDFDGDGNLDLSFSLAEKAGHPFAMRKITCSIAPGNGDGTFRPATLSPGAFESTVQEYCGISRFVDWDGDGDLDAISAGGWRENVNGRLRDSLYSILRNGSTMDALGSPIPVPGHMVEDIDGDGAPDYVSPALTRITEPIIGLGYAEFTFGVAFNDGLGGVAATSERGSNLSIYDALGNPIALPAFALDLDLDGRRDLVFSDSVPDAFGNPTVSRFKTYRLSAENPRDLNEAKLTYLVPFQVPFSDRLLDFDGNGELEYVSEGQFVTPTARGPLVGPIYEFKGPHLFPGFNYSEAVAVDDFDGDGDIDALYAYGFSGLHLVRNTLVDENSDITTALIDRGLTPSEATPLADPDRDGRSNALELIQGTDPLTADEADITFLADPPVLKDSRLHFKRRSDSVFYQIHYEIESSLDLIHWSKIPTSEPTLISTDGTYDRVSIGIPMTSRKQYLRISVAHDPRR